MPKLTKRVVEAIAPASKPVLAFDDEIPGFGVRVLPTGVRSYFLQYRSAQGRQRWMTLGKHGAITVEMARKMARRTRDAVADGKDPAGERRAVRDAPTVGRLLDRYLTDHVAHRNRPSTAKEFTRLVDLHIRPALGGYKVAAVTRSDVVRLHQSMAETPRQANTVLSVCSKVFALAELWELRRDGSNPATRIERYPETKRERHLSPDELGRLGAVLRTAQADGLPWRTGDPARPTAKHLARPERRRTILPRDLVAVIELLLFTGCRLSEITDLEWRRVDMDAAIIDLPKTKAGRPQVVALNAPALAVLADLAARRKVASGTSVWVFPRRDDPERPVSRENMESVWQRVRSAAGLEDVRLHDLRHTVGTLAGQGGANAFLVRDLLRHATLAMTDRYVNRAPDPLRRLSDDVGARIATALASQPYTPGS